MSEQRRTKNLDSFADYINIKFLCLTDNFNATAVDIVKKSMKAPTTYVMMMGISCGDELRDVRSKTTLNSVEMINEFFHIFGEIVMCVSTL